MIEVGPLNWTLNSLTSRGGTEWEKIEHWAGVRTVAHQKRGIFPKFGNNNVKRGKTSNFHKNDLFLGFSKWPKTRNPRKTRTILSPDWEILFREGNRPCFVPFKLMMMSYETQLKCYILLGLFFFRAHWALKLIEISWGLWKARQSIQLIKIDLGHTIRIKSFGVSLSPHSQI